MLLNRIIYRIILIKLIMKTMIRVKQMRVKLTSKAMMMMKYLNGSNQMQVAKWMISKQL